MAGGARPPLDDGRIVRAAVAVADAEGIDAVSMRRVASSVGAGAMSLYRHFSGKDELLDRMLDAAWAGIRVPDRPSGDWRADLSALFAQTRSALARHPWVASLLPRRPLFGTAYLRWFEFSLAALEPTGLPLRAKVRVLGTVGAFMAGFAAYERGEAESARRHRLSQRQKREVATSRLQPLLATGRFPNLALFVSHGTDVATDADFRFGLGCVLDGVASSLRERRPGRRRASR